MTSILGSAMMNTFLQNYWLWDLNNHEFRDTIHAMHNPVQKGLAFGSRVLVHSPISFMLEMLIVYPIKTRRE
jgi:hypothetical protein